MEKGIEEKIEFLFIDMEWNQKAGTTDIEGREPMQIGLLGADAALQETKLFSKSIRLDDIHTLTEETCKWTHTNVKKALQANSLEEVFERVKMSFPKYKYIVVWTRATYDLFMRSARQAGIQVSRHRVVFLQDIINEIALSEGKSIGFESALKRAGVAYRKELLHFAKRDVQYLFALYERVYKEYQKLTCDEIGVVNEKTKILHTPACSRLNNSNRDLQTGVKELVFKGYRACNCCGSKAEMRKLYWAATPTKKMKKINKNKKIQDETVQRNLPLTDFNIQRVCGKYNIKCSISDYVVFLTTNCGYWRIYLDGEKVDKVFHGNLEMRKSERKKKKKCNEGFHQQKIWSDNFYDIVRYIYFHDKDKCQRYRKTKLDKLFEKVEKERKMKEAWG